MRTWPGARHSGHPETGVAAVGGDLSEVLTAEHEVLGGASAAFACCFVTAVAQVDHGEQKHDTDGGELQRSCRSA